MSHAGTKQHALHVEGCDVLYACARRLQPRLAACMLSGTWSGMACIPSQLHTSNSTKLSNVLYSGARVQAWLAGGRALCIGAGNLQLDLRHGCTQTHGLARLFVPTQLYTSDITQLSCVLYAGARATSLACWRV